MNEIIARVFNSGKKKGTIKLNSKISKFIMRMVIIIHFDLLEMMIFFRP
jgi:hypothetical protein